MTNKCYLTLTMIILYKVLLFILGMQTVVIISHILSKENKMVNGLSLMTPLLNLLILRDWLSKHLVDKWELLMQNKRLKMLICLYTKERKRLLTIQS